MTELLLIVCLTYLFWMLLRLVIRTGWCIEATVSSIVAVVAGGAALLNRLHSRINRVHDRITELDKRLDGVELRLASDYVSKADLAEILRKMESHMIRIENKLDQIVIRNG